MFCALQKGGFDPLVRSLLSMKGIERISDIDRAKLALKFAGKPVKVGLEEGSSVGPPCAALCAYCCMLMGMKEG